MMIGIVPGKGIQGGIEIVRIVQTAGTGTGTGTGMVGIGNTSKSKTILSNRVKVKRVK
jgi:hypothetical protein